MQILHWRLSHSQTGSTFNNSSVVSQLDVTESPLSTPGHEVLIHRYPFLATLLSPTKKTFAMDSSTGCNPHYTNNNTCEEGIIMPHHYPKLHSRVNSIGVIPTDATGETHSEEVIRSQGNHYKETDKRGLQKRKRGCSGFDTETEDNNLVSDENGYKFEHSTKAYLILNLYGGDRNGYTFSVYLPETVDNEALLYRESQLISYSETYLTNCIDTETVPHRLVSTLEREHGINLIHHPNCVVCEVRDFRHSTSEESGIKNPITRRVVLKPTTEAILTDLEQLILKSFDDRAFYINTRQITGQSHDTSELEDEAIAFKRMRLTNPECPMEQLRVKALLCQDVSLDNRDELTLDQRHELEKRIVKGVSGGLCLDPSKKVGVIANCAQFERYKWNSFELKESLTKYCRKKHKSGRKGPKFCVLVEDEGELNRRELTVGCMTSLIGQEEHKEEQNVNPPPVKSFLFQDSKRSLRRSTGHLLNFIQKSIESNKLKRDIDSLDKSHKFKLPPIQPIDYSHSPPLSNLEEINALSQPAEPASIRQLFSENFVTKTEEYIFETERRKHPHRTVVTIYQRNGGESYYGELEQEALDEPNTNDSTTMFPNRGNGSTVPIKPYALDPPLGHISGSKCQFELGSSHSVNLYVKQFTDIFTEDGRRPCKITFHKAGQAGPTVLCTSSYKTHMNTTTHNNPAPTSTTSNTNGISSIPGGLHVGANVIIAQSGAPTPPHNSNAIIVSVPSLSQSNDTTPSTISIPIVNTGILQPVVTNSNLNSLAVTTTASSSPSQTNPPVQIVHPQPRLQPNIQISTASQIFGGGIHGAMTTTTIPNQGSSSTVANNNPTRFQQNQLLTRPKIVNVNLTPQQQQQLTITRPTITTIQQTPQLIQAVPQQQGIRVKQLGLTRLLLSTNLQNSAPKPITVIQPQLQNPTVTNSTNVNQVQTIQLNSASIDVQQHHLNQPQQVQIASHPHVGNQTNNQIMIMLASPGPGTALSAQNSISMPSGSSGQHTLTRQPGNVSLNLSAINLDSLLAVSNNNHTNIQQHQQGQTYVTSTALVNTTNTIPPNSLRINSVGVSNASLNTVNIVRYTNSSGTVTLQPQVIRQNSVSIMSPQQQAAILTMNSSPTTGIILNNTQNITTKPVRLQHTIRQQNHPELEEISVPDLNTLLSNGCGPNRGYGRTSTTSKVPSIDVNLNLNLNLSGTPASTVTGAAQAPTMSELYSSGRQNGPSVGNVNSVDSIFNALSEAIGPDLEHKLENSLVQTSTSLNARLTSSSPTISQKTSVMTLNDLLGSPPMSASTSNQPVPSPLHSPQSPSISSILSPISPNVVTSSIGYTTPRLSALLSGTPSADSTHNLLLEPPTTRGGTSSGNCGNLFDRLLSQGQTVAVPVQRTGGSRLNPIASATPSVALDHPVLAATLTQGTNPNLRHALTRPTTYRQIAPAPPPIIQPSVSTQQQQQQIITNLLGLMGTSSGGNQSSQSHTIRISKTNHSSSGTGTR